MTVAGWRLEYFRIEPVTGSALDIPAEPATGCQCLFGALRAPRTAMRIRAQRVQNSRSRPHSGPTGDARTTLVFLHPGLGSASSWQDFPEALCRRIGCAGLVYSRWGHGKSEGIREPLSVRFMHDEAQTIVPALLSAFQIQ